MRDVWQQHHARLVFTHYYPTGATRLDRFYATKELFSRKIAAETVVAAFTDHHTVTLRMAVDVPIIHTDRGMRKLNASLLHNAEWKAKLGQHWQQWKDINGYSPSLPCGGADL